jgi:hypothetical protein
LPSDDDEQRYAPKRGVKSPARSTQSTADADA